MKLVRWLCLVLSMSLCLATPVQAQTATRTFVVYAGTYSGTQTYAKGDVVLSGTTYFLSLSSTNIGHTPASSPTYWALFTSTPPQVNGVTLQSPLPNMIDSSSVKFTNPSAGSIQATVGIVPNSTPTRIATTSCSGSTSGTSTAASLVMTCSGTYTKGNTIILSMISTQSLGAFPTINTSVTDTQGNVWTRIRADLGRGFSESGAVYVATNIAGGTDTITVGETVSGGAGNIQLLGAIADEFSGVNTVSTVLQSAQAAGTSGTASVAFSLPVTIGGELMYGAIMEEATNASTYAGTNYTSLGSFCPVVGTTHMCLGRLTAISSVATPAIWAPTFTFTTQGGGGSYFFIELVGSGNPAVNPITPITAAGGIASVAGSTLSVGKVSGAATTSAVIANPTVNTINTASGTAIYNTIVSGNGNTIGANTYQFIGGGQTNTTSNDYATVGGGHSNTASGANSTVPGGTGNIASGNVGVAVGDACTASGDHAQCRGHGAIASGARSYVFGEFSDDRTNMGSWVWSPSGPSQTATARDRATWEEHVMYAAGTGVGTVLRLTADGGVAAAGNVAALAVTSGAQYTFDLLLIDRTTNAAISYSFGNSVAIRPLSGTIALGSTNPAAVLGGVTSGAPTLSTPPTITADTTNGGFNISVTLPNTDNWYAVGKLRELTSIYN